MPRTTIQGGARLAQICVVMVAGLAFTGIGFLIVEWVPLSDSAKKVFQQPMMFGLLIIAVWLGKRTYVALAKSDPDAEYHAKHGSKPRHNWPQK